MKRWLWLIAAVAGCASGVFEPKGDPAGYVALGDSVAFGYSPLVDLTQVKVSGYPEALAGMQGMDVMNFSCPGEASGGFMSPTGADNHCRENREKYPLHVDYQGTQLVAAMEYLQQHADTTTLVTIDLGANDLFLLDHTCNRDLTCIVSGLVATMAAYNNNMGYIIAQLRTVYTGPLVGLAIYNPTPADSTAEFAIEKLDAAFADVITRNGGIVADGRAAFAAASADPCADGLLIALPDGTCDVHPTPKGAQLLANTIADVMPQ